VKKDWPTVNSKIKVEREDRKLNSSEGFGGCDEASKGCEIWRGGTVRGMTGKQQTVHIPTTDSILGMARASILG
jgi:hypothetical protein